MALTIAFGGSAVARADSQIFSMFDFQFEDGSVMPELRIAYDTQGTLSPAGDNAIVLLPDALGDRHAFDPLIGPDKLFDTKRYFVITPEVIGGGEATSPADGGGQDFPRYTIRDMAAAEHALVTRGLGLTQLRAVIGRSMGASIALEWAIQHPELARRLALLAPAARSDANYRVVIDLMTAAVALDPDWNGGRYERNPLEGLRHAGMTYYPWSVSAAYLDRLPESRLAQESEASAKRFAAWDANALVLRLAACRGHDVGTSPAGAAPVALARVTAPVLLLPSASDRLVAPADAQQLRDALPHATYAEIPGDLGRTAIAAPPGTSESGFIENAIRSFLK
ncbi:MAG TPA: alpha/beta fold hydrolase [Stellaceae bacterium]|nr:alpha/beta fold hydrolase [Stellaceae bacterium]